MLDANEMINMANYIREKTTRCRSDIANVFDRIVELDSIAKSLEDLAKKGMAGNPDGPVGGSPLAPTEINNIDVDNIPQQEATTSGKRKPKSAEKEVVAVGSIDESEKE